MLEQVELKIQELQKKQTEEYYRKKDEDLNAWGLTTKKDGKKTIPIIVTDEEYEALIEASNGVGRSGRNSLAITFNVVSAAIMLLGSIGGIVLGYFAENLGFVYFSLTVLGSGLLALIFRGFAEAIRLLQQLVDNRPTVISPEQKANYEAEKAAKEAPAQAPAQAPVQPPIYQQPIYVQTQPQYQQPPFAPQAPYQQVPYQQVYVQTPTYPQNPEQM